MSKARLVDDMRFFDTLLDALPEAVTVVNADGIVLRWNHTASELYTIPKNHIIGQHIGRFFERGSLMLLTVIDSGLPVYGVYHQPTPEKHVYINAVPVTDDTGKTIGAISIEQDITDVIRLNDEQFHLQALNSSTDWHPVFDTKNRILKEALSFIDKIQSLEPMSPLLLIGESGVGKSILARLLHTGNRTGPFVSLNCRVTSDGLLDIELFGQGSGHFEFVSANKTGKLEITAQGTLYLQNIDQMATKTQIKLAKALQEGGFLKNQGGFVPISCRVLASIDSVEQTTKPLEQELQYTFHTLKIPPLRERREDLPALCHFYLSQASKQLSKPLPTLKSEVTAALANHDWPGNLPELKKVMEYLIILADDQPLALADLPAAIRPPTINELTDGSVPLGTLSQELERQRIARAMAQSRGNKAKAARLLGISRGALYYKLRQYQIDH